jgi:hypothetical protein
MYFKKWLFRGGLLFGTPYSQLDIFTDFNVHTSKVSDLSKFDMFSSFATLYPDHSILILNLYLDSGYEKKELKSTSTHFSYHKFDVMNVDSRFLIDNKSIQDLQCYF